MGAEGAERFFIYFIYFLKGKVSGKVVKVSSTRTLTEIHCKPLWVVVVGGKKKSYSY